MHERGFSSTIRAGRPLGTDNLLGYLEKTLGRVLRRKKPGPKKTEGELN
jgi:hypothetical protein